MKLQQVLRKTTWQEVKYSLIDNYEEHALDNIENYHKVYNELKTLKPIQAEKIILNVVKQEDEQCLWYNVYGTTGILQKDMKENESFLNKMTDDFKNSEVTYGLEFIPWEEWLNMSVSEKTLKEFSLSDILAHCLYEMTFINYDQNSIQDQLEILIEQKNQFEIDRQIKDYD
jgi:hypothetical protein